MPIIRRMIGESIPAKIRFGSMVFVVLGFVAMVVFKLDHYDWPSWLYLGVSTSGMLIGSDGGDRKKYLNGPEDLDRPGGPYDKLHGRI